jgi:hypothetical protein
MTLRVASDAASAVVLVIAAFACCLATGSADPPVAAASPMRNVEDQLSDGLVPVSRMVNFFLDDIVQTRLLTSMPDEYTESSSAWMDSWADHWDEWLVHYIGFVVCGAIGVVGIVAMLLAALIFPCCRCCGRCGAKDPETTNGRRKSKCCIRVSELSLAIVTVSLILSSIPLYVVNERFYPQLKEGVFVAVNKSLDCADQFMDQVSVDINDAVYGGYVELEADVFATLDSVPAGAMTAIDNATGAVTTLNELSRFTGNLPALSKTINEAIRLANELSVDTTQMWNDFVQIRDDLIRKLNGCQSGAPQCQVRDYIFIDITGVLPY